MSTVYNWTHSEEFTPTSLSICCPRCENSLTLHQPDPELPNRLLATCDECKSWFLANSNGVPLAPIRELSNGVNSPETKSLFPRINL